MQSLRRCFFGSLSMLVAVSVGACGLPIGVEYREMYVSQIDAPDVVKRGQAVNVTLINPVTPQGEPSVSVQVDDAQRVVTFVVTEYEVQQLLGGRSYAQMMVERPLMASFTPGSSGNYQLRTRGGVATATVRVED
jgi:hypothetical protein